MFVIVSMTLAWPDFSFEFETTTEILYTPVESRYGAKISFDAVISVDFKLHNVP